MCVLTLKGSRKHPLPTRQVCSLISNALGDGLGEPGISTLLFAMTMLFLLSFFLLNGMVWGPGLWVPEVGKNFKLTTDTEKISSNFKALFLKFHYLFVFQNYICIYICVCIYIICVCVQIYARKLRCLWKTEDSDIPGSGVPGSFEPPFLRVGIQTQVLSFSRTNS